MKCLVCGTENRELDEPSCVGCGQSLRPTRAQHYLDQAEAKIKQGHYDEAVAQISNADLEMLPLRQEQRNQFLLNARAFILQAAIYYDRGLIEDARRELQMAYDNLEPLPHGRALLAEVFNRLGNTYYFSGDEAEALACYQKVVPIALESGLYLLATKAISNIGNLYISMGRLEDARAVFDQSAELAQRLTDPEALTIAYATLVRFHAQDGLHSRALEYADKVLAVYEDVPSFAIRCTALSDVITIYTYYGYHSQAETHLRTLYKMVHSSPNRVLRDMTGERIGELAQRVGDASAWYVTALKELNTSHTRTLRTTRDAWALAIYYVLQGEVDSIRRHLAWMRRSTLDKEQGSELFRAAAYAMLHTALGEWSEAAKSYQAKLASTSLNLYERANTLEQYAEMLIRWQASAPSAERRATIDATLREVASLFERMESQLRWQHVSELLAQN